MNKQIRPDACISHTQCSNMNYFSFYYFQYNFKLKTMRTVLVINQMLNCFNEFTQNKQYHALRVLKFFLLCHFIITKYSNYHFLCGVAACNLLVLITFNQKIVCTIFCSNVLLSKPVEPHYDLNMNVISSMMTILIYAIEVAIIMLRT